MAENEYTRNRSYKRVRQPPQVPFLWEVKPGMPKKDWKPVVGSSSQAPHAPQIPLKLVASVPFKWEEKPGTPLPSCIQSQPESLSPPTLSLPIMYSHHFDDPENSCNNAIDDENDQGMMFDLEFETFGFETDDDSFTSAVPTLLANCLVSSSRMSTAVPVESFSMDSFSDMSESPSSPSTETDSGSTSSYVTGTSSLVGASFLECLFPLLPPHSGLLEKVGNSEKSSVAHTPEAQEKKDFDGRSNGNAMVRRPPTLGELIMMSRRRSMQRKAIEMRKRNPSMELIEERPSGCCMIGSKFGLIEGLQKKIKWQPTLRLV